MTTRQRKRRTFKILHAPLHGNSATNAEMQHALSRPGVIAVVFTEAYRHASFLKTRPKWRTTTGGTRRNARGTMVARDIAILTRRWRRPISSGVRRGSIESRPAKIAPERFVTFTVDMLHGKPLAVIGLHPNAAVRNAWNTDRAEKYRDNLKEAFELVHELRAEYGDHLDIVITGDLQYTQGDVVRAWSPRDLFDRLDMHWVASGLDWVAYSDGLRLVSTDIIDPSENGQDHAWIEAEFERIE